MASRDRECPGCGSEKLLSPREAKQVYRINKWKGNTILIEDADLVCSWCKAVKIDGNWTRMQTLASRANELAQVSSTKSANDYRDSLTAGDLRL